MNVRSWGDLVLSMIKVSLLRATAIILYQVKNNILQGNNAIFNNVVDEILLNETQKVVAVREAPGFWTPIMVRTIYISLRK